MGEKSNNQSLVKKKMKSVFVGNIPYEATEEELKEIFCEVGPVVSFRFIVDHESCIPKGFGFCEYKDQKTAQRAMRNLNGYEIFGRALRVNNAHREISRMEMQHPLQEPQVESPRGEHCEPGNAPEEPIKTVLVLPPEQMYELMKQMKTSIPSDPAYVRNMLLLNPQLTSALSVAQIATRTADPQAALSMLHKANQIPTVWTSSTMQLPVEIVSTPTQTPVVQPLPSVLSQSSTSAPKFQR